MPSKKDRNSSGGQSERHKGHEGYEGDLKGGKFDGKGTFKYADGDVYEGNWKAGKREGHGIYRYASGRADVVTYKADVDVGEGVRWSADRQMAWKLQDGNIVDEISLEEAQEIALRVTKGTLDQPPAPHASNLNPNSPTLSPTLAAMTLKPGFSAKDIATSLPPAAPAIGSD